ncbi:hypothetical protein N7462_004677 [Penicillium macrosclerotiorum]|uniref:uncharacterized protein n=1 Tax=Penicillium macrosclerotiorum TaxID=303699 RepID=UPI002548EEDE|nr:uncharacterized protein N7462_004677 [Penicillium macrosclerotiorum]KAJ5690285.1 hypothetical protein N7462_004677 [Penicillium macrosclerotiorum]
MASHKPNEGQQAYSSDESEEKKEEEEEEEGENNLLNLQNLNQRRTQNAQFEALLTEHALCDDLKVEKRELLEIPDDELSVARLVAKQDIGGRNLDPRVYQIELFERAKAQNTIAVLDTGAGKTLIAVLLLKHILEQELIDRGLGKAPRVAFFLVDSVTLVFQQSAVLRNNLNQNVGHIFGSMGPDLWDQETWNVYLRKNMVIVCTAEILTQCLLNAFAKMSQINLLIFDEAHHTKKDHPYARIIRESYLKVDSSERPRIFGMTASPIDCKRKSKEAAVQLEALLDSRIATTSHQDLLSQVVRRPTEEIWTYKKLGPPFATELYSKLEQNFHKVRALEPVFRFAWNASSELGAWCADQVWTQALKDEVMPKLESILDNESNLDSQECEEARKCIIEVREVCDLVKTYPFRHPSEPGQLSSKVELLSEKLSYHFRTSEEKKCIVFTERRSTAKMLLRLFELLKMPNLRPGILIGIRNSDMTGSITFRHQFLALVKFRQGEINCLFATSVAEEGLDIPDCNLVVRFNIYQTLIQYVQSRGRARHANSTYATMIEVGNEAEKQRVKEVQEAQIIMQTFCQTLPEDRLLRGLDHDLNPVLRKDEGTKIYTIPSTGAKLTFRHAITILGRYASSLQSQNNDCPQVHYFMASVGEKFICEVLLPESSPIHGLIGKVAHSKGAAKQSAAFDTCILLRKKNLLDDHFRSIYHKRLPAMRNARLAIALKKRKKYPMRCKPLIWSYQKGIIPVSLYAMVIGFVPSSSLVRNHEQLVLLTRKGLPKFPSFPIYLDDGVETVVQTHRIEVSFSINPEKLGLLTDFTLSVFNDIFHKKFDTNSEELPYWLAPAHPELDIISSIASVGTVIDWAALYFVHTHKEWRWSESMKAESLLDRLLYDPFNGKYRYFPIAVDPYLHPSNPPPAHVPWRKYMQDILNYSVSLGRNSRRFFLDHCNWNQPVLHAEVICLRRNLLDKAPGIEDYQNPLCVICPQAMVISAINSTTVTSCLAFPAIISRLESYLIVLEGCQKLGLEIDLGYALEAFTKDSDNTEEHRALQIHVQRGMGKNYERLEFLGDTFLKMATSIALFCKRPDDDEFDYHVNRMCLICNQNLFNTARGIQLFEYIRSRSFSRHMWFPPGLNLVKGRDFMKHVPSESSHNLADKTIADVCEALIGASLLSGGKDHRFDMAVQAVTIFVNGQEHTAASWADYRASYKKPDWQSKPSDGYERNLSQMIFEDLGYRFNYPRLMRSAITHPSIPKSQRKVPCYQRLEFLGDSLLDMACVEELFHRFPDKDPQWLTEHKMAMVSNKFLGALAVKLGLHRHLQYSVGPIQSQVNQYVEDIQLAEAECGGEMDYWLHIADSPKCLPDILEAYLGAAFIDSDLNYTVIEDFFSMHVKPFFEDMSLYDTFANRHPTTFLHQRMTNFYGCMSYCLKSGEVPVVDSEPPRIFAAVMVHGIPVGEATGTSSRYAKVRASERALEVLEELPKSEFQLKYCCDCRSVEQKEKDTEIGTAV